MTSAPTTVNPSATTDERPGQATSPSRPMPAAKTPVGTGAVQVVGVVLALLVTALGAAALRDAVLATGLIDGTPWVLGAVESLDGLRPDPWVLVVGVVLVLVGLWLVVCALRPRPRTGLALRADTGVFLRPRGVSRLATAAAEDVDGVLDASAATTRRSVSVRVTTTGDDGTPDAVRAAVSARLAHLDPTPKVKVRTRSEGAR